jgi:hypothetical protein
MNAAQTSAMLQYLKAADPYMVADEPAVLFWLDALLPSVDESWARKFWGAYLGKDPERRPHPAILNDAWKAHLTSREIAGADRGRSCGRSECVCTHTTCDHGWMPSRTREDAVVPCPICKGETAEVLARLPEPGKREPWEMSAVSEHYRRRKAVGA